MESGLRRFSRHGRQHSYWTRQYFSSYRSKNFKLIFQVCYQYEQNKKSNYRREKYISRSRGNNSPPSSGFLVNYTTMPFEVQNLVQ